VVGNVDIALMHSILGGPVHGQINTYPPSRSGHSMLRVLAGDEPPEQKMGGIEEVDAAISFHKRVIEEG